MWAAWGILIFLLSAFEHSLTNMRRSSIARQGRTTLSLLFLVPYATFVAIKSCNAEQLIICVVVGVIYGAAIQSNLAMKTFSMIAKMFPKPSSTPIRSQILDLCVSISSYDNNVQQIIDRKKRLFFMLNKEQQNNCVQTYRRLLENHELQKKNSEFLELIKDSAVEQFDIGKLELMGKGQNTSVRAANEIIEHLVRDWSQDEKARKELFEPILKHCQNKKRVLVPGCGLGKLAYEVAALEGVENVDAIEFNAPMYFVANNRQLLQVLDKSTLYPNLFKFSNWRNGADQLEGVTLDLSAALTPKADAGQVEVVYQDFLKMKTENYYDCLASLFFIDTAQNIFEYIDQIRRQLKKGGVWVNYGPLQYGTAAYAELSADELFEYIESSGWKIVERWTGTNRYNGSEKSMLHTAYGIIGFACIKE